MQKRMVVLKRDNEYVAGVFSPLGLFQCSLPRKSRDEAIDAVKGANIPIHSNPDDLTILELIFDMIEGKNVPNTSIPYDFSNLTEKQIDVLKATLEIPKGETRTYGEVAANAKIPNAARFVGNVMAKNRFAPLIPCHRVVSSNGIGGYLGGYGEGIAKKEALLKREGAFAD